MTKFKTACVGIGFMTMLFGAAGADSSLVFAALLITIGAALMLIGRAGMNEDGGYEKSVIDNRDCRVVISDIHKYRRR